MIFNFTKFEVALIAAAIEAYIKADPESGAALSMAPLLERIQYGATCDEDDSHR